MKRTALAGLVIIAGFLVGFLYFSQRTPLSPQMEKPYLQFGSHKIHLEIADDPDERRDGLSGRESLPANSGMLFVFPEEGRYAFTMNGMLFPLDFVWLDENLRVVEIDEEIPAPPRGQSGRLLEPKEPVRYVLELTAGTVKQIKIQVGSLAQLTPQ